MLFSTKNVTRKIIIFMVVLSLLMCEVGNTYAYQVNDIRSIPTDEYNMIISAHPNATENFILLDYQYGESYATTNDTPLNAVAGVSVTVQNYVRDTDFEANEIMNEYSEHPAYSEDVPELDYSPIKNAGKIYPDEALSAEDQQNAKYLANYYNIPLEILMGIAFTESEYTEEIISADGGDWGLCQINKINHQWLKEAIGRDLNYLNSYDSLESAAYILNYLNENYPGSSWGYKLMCYNMGERNASINASNGVYESSYSRKVLAKAYELGFK